MASTKDVLDHHLHSFSEGNLKGILSDFAPDAVLFTPNGTLKGLRAIQPFFEASSLNLENRVLPSTCGSKPWKVITPTCCGARKPPPRRMKSPPTRSSFGTEKSLRSRSPQKSHRRADSASHISLDWRRGRVSK